MGRATVRTIKKRSQPKVLTQWRAPRLAAGRTDGMECIYDEMRRRQDVLEAVEDSLLAEQGSLCAYTGQRIDIEPSKSEAGDRREVDFHIEHLTPQVRGYYGQDTDYANLVACWPRPNCGFEPSYGARKKGNWPSPAEQDLFVSPLRDDCSKRFVFNRRGEIKPAKVGDTAAEETIRRLVLCNRTLTALRREAIRGALSPQKRASYPTALRSSRLWRRKSRNSRRLRPPLRPGRSNGDVIAGRGRGDLGVNDDSPVVRKQTLLSLHQRSQ